MGDLSQQCSTRRGKFRTPAGYRVCARIDVESHTFVAKRLKQIEEEMQRGRQQRYTLTPLQFR